jgi:hypothetical protein
MTLGGNLGQSRLSRLQAARDTAKKNNNFMVSEQPGSGVQLGQSVDTDFGQGQSRDRFGGGRVRAVIQQLGETDLGLADTLEGSESVDAMQMINNRLGGGLSQGDRNYVAPKINITDDSKLYNSNFFF